MSGSSKKNDENQNGDDNSKSEAKLNETMRELLNKAITLKVAAERGDDCLEEATNITQEADEIVRNAKCSSTAYLAEQIRHTCALIFKNFKEQMDSQFSGFKSSEQQQDNRETDNLIDAPIKNPNMVNSAEKEDEDLDKHMKTMMGLILKWECSNKVPLQFWNLVLNPDSFSETIENIFFVSHLLLKKMVNVEQDPNGLPVIKAVRKEQSGGSSDNSDNFIALTINQSLWKALIEALKIKKPMFPTRGHNLTSERGGDQ